MINSTVKLEELPDDSAFLLPLRSGPVVGHVVYKDPGRIRVKLATTIHRFPSFNKKTLTDEVAEFSTNKFTNWSRETPVIPITEEEFKNRNKPTIKETKKLQPSSTTGPVVPPEKKKREKQVIAPLDDLAAKLKELTLDATYMLAAKELKEPAKKLKDKYGHLNPGLQRMNLGNRIRARRKS